MAINPHHDDVRRDLFGDLYGGAWSFNEIIGYIQLHFLGWQIRGDYWRVAAKRIVRTRKKLLKWCTHKLASERDLPGDSSNAEIFRIVRSYVASCAEESFVNNSPGMRAAQGAA
jgi:hypothetical protein